MGKRRVRKYTEEFKRSSVELAVKLGESINQIAQELGMSVSTLHGWVRRYGANLMKKGLLSDADKLLEELKSVKKKNSRLTKERDILKKAVAYFASETQ